MTKRDTITIPRRHNIILFEALHHLDTQIRIRLAEDPSFRLELETYPMMTGPASEILGLIVDAKFDILDSMGQ